MQLRKKIIHATYLLLICSAVFSSCKKQNEWLDIKAVKSDVSPQTLSDFQAILDNSILNNTSNVGLLGTDNFYFTDVNFNSLNQELRNLYTWNKEIWISETSANWGAGFKNIEYANIVLDGLLKIKQADPEYNSIKGTALFDRAFAYYNLAQLFCKPYSSSAAADLGLPLKLNADVNEVNQRAPLKETYQQMIDDLNIALTLLPENQGFITRPGTPAVYALLAKVYLQMEDYQTALGFANKSLAIKSQLLDFNNTELASLAVTYRFPTYAKNIPEVLFYVESTQFADLSPQASSKAIVSPELYNNYEANDLRKSLFYALSGSDAKYRGTYSGNIFNFSGLAVNEVLLIRAECLARTGNLTAGDWIIWSNGMWFKDFPKKSTMKEAPKKKPINVDDDFDFDEDFTRTLKHYLQSMMPIKIDYTKFLGFDLDDYYISDIDIVLVPSLPG
ncbi:MAG: hypothetical protein EOO88_36380, partial [Pedobacter sp.]